MELEPTTSPYYEIDVQPTAPHRPSFPRSSTYFFFEGFRQRNLVIASWLIIISIVISILHQMCMLFYKCLKCKDMFTESLYSVTTIIIPGLVYQPLMMHCGMIICSLIVSDTIIHCFNYCMLRILLVKVICLDKINHNVNKK